MWIEGVRVILSCVFLRKTLKRRNLLTSKNQLTKRKPTHKKKTNNKMQTSKQTITKTTEGSIFSCAQKLLRGWKLLICVLCIFVRLKVFHHKKIEVTLIPSIYATTHWGKIMSLISIRRKKCAIRQCAGNHTH